MRVSEQCEVFFFKKKSEALDGWKLTGQHLQTNISELYTISITVDEDKRRMHLAEHPFLTDEDKTLFPMDQKIID